MLKRTLWLLFSAAVIGVGVLCLILWSARWDKPEITIHEIAAQDLQYRGIPIQVSVKCTCPRIFLEGQAQTTYFAYSIRPRPQTPGPTPVAPTSPAPVAPRPSAPGPEGAVGVVSVWVWLEPVNATINLGPNTGPDWLLEIGPAYKVESRLEKVGQAVSMTPTGSGPPLVTFHFQEGVSGKPPYTEIGSVQWKAETHPPFLTAMFPFIAASLVFGFAFLAFFLIDRRLRQLRNRTEHRLKEARQAAAGNANQTHVAWEIASIKLEAYFDRNLIQVNLVFWVAVLVMVVGFGFVLAGVVLSFRNSKDLSTAGLAAISGIITQFIGVTFMVIYRSTMRQANDFMSILERINTVGMAVRELDRISDNPPELKNTVRAHVVELLLGVHPSPAKQATSSTEERRRPSSDDKV